MHSNDEALPRVPALPVLLTPQAPPQHRTWVAGEAAEEAAGEVAGASVTQGQPSGCWGLCASSLEQAGHSRRLSLS